MKLLEIDNSLTIRKQAQAQEYSIDEQLMSQPLQMAVSFKKKFIVPTGCFFTLTYSTN